MRFHYKNGGVATKLVKHANQHSKKHMLEMKKRIKQGNSFAESHNRATKKVGK